MNHNGFVVRSGVRAGGLKINHNVVVRSGASR